MLTDWTKDDGDEDSKFWNWMEQDKENYNKKHPRKLERPKNKKKKVIIFGIIGLTLMVTVFGMLSNEDEFGSEKYFYIPDYRLNKSPLFCIQDFSDPFFPGINTVMIEKTASAIENWGIELERYTETDGVWNFEFKTIPANSIFADFGCDTTIAFAQIPPVGQEIVRGETALSNYGFSDVMIFYLDPISRDKIDSNIDLVIAHEIGHVLGLDHPLFEEMNDGLPYYLDNDDIFYSRSIMVTPEVYPFLPSETIYTVTDYDVRAVVNLYGGGISNTPIFFGYLNYIIVISILLGLVYFVNKKIP
ncbi:MAG: hypothetical protein GKS07_00940 [Nitrosopumilus sp.]|nr:MAG: hypothetical protein GKS07_00940 [Nitrosopumilus sp.]